jgi:lauroyl/myristoyl acyltransferase
VRFLPSRSRLKYYAMVVVLHTIGRLPINWRYGFARFISNRSYDWRPTVRNNIRSNVRHVLGPDASEAQIDRVARECAQNTGRYYADLIGMHRMDVKKFFEEDLVLEGLEHIVEAQKSGHGVVLASAHYANPEFAVQGLSACGLRIFALVEQLEPPELGRLMNRLRSNHGHVYEPVGFAGVKKAIAWLREGGIVAILVDRDIQKRGVEIEFCGSPARFPTGAVDLAMRTNAVVVPAWVRRERNYKIHVVIGPPMPLVITGNSDEDARVNTANLLARFERHLKQDPGQWSVTDRIWPDHQPQRPPAPQPEEEPQRGEKQAVQ